MSTLKVLKEQEIKTFENAMKLRNIPFDVNIKSYEKRKKLQQRQDEIYKQNKFYKGLIKHWKEEKKYEK